MYGERVFVCKRENKPHARDHSSMPSNGTQDNTQMESIIYTQDAKHPSGHTADCRCQWGLTNLSVGPFRRRCGPFAVFPPCTRVLTLILFQTLHIPLSLFNSIGQSLDVVDAITSRRRNPPFTSCFQLLFVQNASSPLALDFDRTVSSYAIFIHTILAIALYALV